MPRASRGLRLFLAAVLFAASVAAFVLPFCFPPHEPVVSVAYIAGASNRVAVIALALLSLAVAVAFWRRAAIGLEPEALPSPQEAGVSPRLLAGGAALILIEVLLLGSLVVHTGIRYGDADYFLARLRDLQLFPVVLYRDLEFAYGPMLLYPALWLARAGLPLETAYFSTLAAMDVLGLAMMAYVLNRLPLTRAWQRGLFMLCVLLQAEPVLSPNYSLFKFALPYAGLLWGIRQRSPLRATAAFTGALLAVLLDSPELAIGLSAAILLFAVLRGMMRFAGLPRHRSYMFILASPMTAYAVFLGILGPASLARIGQAGRGALNLILDPMVYVLIFCFALVWLVPRTVGTQMGRRSSYAPEAAATFVLALGILPGALGRVYGLHVMFDGLGFLLLSAVAAMRLPRPQRLVWAVALSVVFFWCILVSTKSQLPLLREIAFDLHHPEANQNQVDLGALDRLVGHGTPVALPVTLYPLETARALERNGNYRPDFYPGLGEIWTPADERRKIADLRAYRWLLLPRSKIYLEYEGLPNGRLRRILRLGYRYPERNPPYVVGVLLDREIHEHWVQAASFGDLLLYRRTS